jgi:hypothetical protein
VSAEEKKEIEEIRHRIAVSSFMLGLPSMREIYNLPVAPEPIIVKDPE